MFITSCLFFHIPNKPIKYDTNVVNRDDIPCGRDDMCIICFYPLKEKGKVVETKCKHIYHKKCIYEWFNKLSKEEKTLECPLCRNQVEIL